MKHTLFALIACSVLANSASAFTFKVKVDLEETPSKEPVNLEVPKGAEKAAGRYFRLAEKTHPLLIAHEFAAPTGQATFQRGDDPLDGLGGGLIDDDAILSVDKDVEYVIRTNGGHGSFVLMIVNRKDEDLTAEIELRLGKMFEPVYRRVYSEDGGKSWTTAAWQPPRASALYPWTIDVPANTVQTVTICLRR